jgi:hypothetical protein
MEMLDASFCTSHDQLKCAIYQYSYDEPMPKIETLYVINSLAKRIDY